ncbi:MAG: ester cyclase [Acidimicrobiia bacterium]|jgi:steroid delta-isomerase-like uncharacterized protein
MSTPPETTSAEAHIREVFRRIFDERDLSDPSAFWSEASHDEFLAAGLTVRGAEALAGFFGGLFAAVPDWRLEIENVVDDGTGQLVVQWTGTGTFTGAPFLGIEATGRSLTIRGVDVIRLDAEGRIDTNTIYYDGAEFARQVGLLPGRDSLADRWMMSLFNNATKLRRAVKR